VPGPLDGLQRLGAKQQLVAPAPIAEASP